MSPMRVLVVFYSRTGTTRELARAIRDELGCEIERIADKRRRAGLLGYLRSGFDAALRRTTTLHPMNTDPGDFDLVLVGTPVWNGSVATPIRTYLATNRDRIRRVAFFCTYGGSGSARALRQMAALCRRPPVATLALRTKEVRRGPIAGQVREFASSLQAAPAREQAASGVPLHLEPAPSSR